MGYKDLRQWLKQVDDIGELKVVKDADWNLEIGAVTDLAVRNPRKSPAVLFDEIKGYPPGYRVLASLMNSAQRLSFTLGMSSFAGDLEFITSWRKKLTTIKPIPPKMVKQGPVMENIRENGDVNLWDFPVPLWNELDGGRYIGTASTTITMDPDTGRVNFGTYRVMVHDKNTAGFYISPGKHGRMNRDKWFARGKPCPVAVVVGGDPLIFMASVMPLIHSKEGFETELHWAGGVRGEAIEVFPGKFTGLPLPAHAEIIIEGESLPGKMQEEGPFLEWTGYYASSKRPEPVIDVKTVYHRNDPILMGVMKGPMPNDFLRPFDLMRAAELWNELESVGVPEIRGVACYLHRFITVVSIKQAYAGHVKQTAMLASQCAAGAYLGRYVIVVDEDIDIYDFDNIVWALATRVDPAQDIEIVTDCWSGPLDPVIPFENKGFNSRALINAAKPYKWRDKFPPSAALNPEVKARVKEKWSNMGVFE